MGGGGDDIAGQQAAAEAKKQTARDALNLQFGVAPTSSAAPTRDAFTSTTYGPGGGTSGNLGASGDSGGGFLNSGTPTTSFDQAGFDAATAAYNGQAATARANLDARNKLYQGVRDDAFNAGKIGLDTTRDTAARNNSFALFGQGLNGGSEDIDENALLNRTYNQGVLNLGAKADAAESTLKSNDEQTRLGLLQSIDSGLDQGSALSSSINQLAANSDTAAANAQGTDLGDLFADTGLLYTKSKAGQGVADARSAFNSFYPYPGAATTGGSGTIRRGGSGIFSQTG